MEKDGSVTYPHVKMARIQVSQIWRTLVDVDCIVLSNNLLDLNGLKQYLPGMR